jgi:nucleotide-binding universal stress UspA family protein
MKKILVPVDFSKTSQNAYFYAIEWARVLGGSIHLVNIYSGSFDPKEALVVSDLETRHDQILSELTHFMHTASNNNSSTKDPLVSVTIDAYLGFAGEKIVSLSEDFDMVIMGSTGRSGILEKIFGSVSSLVSKHATCPVMLIPHGTTFKSPDNILYAANLQSIDESMIDFAIDMADTFESAIHFVHVTQDESGIAPFKEKVFRELLVKKKINRAYYISTVIDDDVLEGLSGYQKANQIDLFVIVSLKRSFWDSILHKSTTKRLALSPKNVPCMVLHAND